MLGLVGRRAEGGHDGAAVPAQRFGRCVDPGGPADVDVSNEEGHGPFAAFHDSALESGRAPGAVGALVAREGRPGEPSGERVPILLDDESRLRGCAKASRGEVGDGDRIHERLSGH